MLEVQVEGVERRVLKAIYYKAGLVSCLPTPAHDKDFESRVESWRDRTEGRALALHPARGSILGILSDPLSPTRSDT